MRYRAERVRSTVAPSAVFPVTRINRRADGPDQPHLGRVGRHFRHRLPRGGGLASIRIAVAKVAKEGLLRGQSRTMIARRARTLNE